MFHYTGFVSLEKAFLELLDLQAFFSPLNLAVFSRVDGISFLLSCSSSLPVTAGALRALIPSS